MNYVGTLDKDKELIDNSNKIIIYGAGGYGEKIYRNLALFGGGKML